MNREYNSLFNDEVIAEKNAPDIFTWEPERELLPPDDFVLCRDENGKPTAVYGQDIWDFRPYNLAATRLSKFNFGSIQVDNCSESECKKIQQEVKYLLFCLIYFANTGRIGSLTPATLNSYYGVLMKAARFCLAMKERPLVGILSLSELYSNQVYLQTFVRIHDKITDNKKNKALLGHLRNIGFNVIGFNPVAQTNIKFGSTESNQHVVIPTRIYLAAMDQLSSEMDFICGNSDGIESFIKMFTDPHYGASHATQKTSAIGGRANWRPEFKEAVEEHGLTNLYIEHLGITERRSLTLALYKMQYLCKHTLHMYTGMRDEEVNRLPYMCTYDEFIEESIKSEDGKLLDEGRAVKLLSTDANMVELISTTTKFEGYKKTASWYAPEEALKAISILQKICRAITGFFGVEIRKETPLMLSPGLLKSGVYDESFTSNFNKRHKPKWMESLIITESDFEEMRASDPLRNFALEEQYGVGKPWPFKSHQHRRSLAFYGSNSGFLSLPSLKRQFKHMTIEMSRYYQKNFENVKSIFGYFNAEKGEYELPKDHFIFDFQMGMPANVAHDIMTEVLGKDSPLFGKTGSYIEKQRDLIREGKIDIKEIRTDTEKRVARGELAYKPTLLGGCTKIGPCDSFMLGDFTECLSCHGAIIDAKKVDIAIEETENELSMYETDSNEFYLTKEELGKLKSFKTHSIERSKVFDKEGV